MDGQGVENEVVINGSTNPPGAVLPSATTATSKKRPRALPSSDYDSSDDDNPSKHLKVLIEDSVKKFLAQNVEPSKDSNTRKRKALGFFQKSTEIAWRGQGNRRQFEFNEQLLDDLDYLKSYVKRGSHEKITKLINEMDESLLHRQKLIRIADRSEGGWKTALEYEHDELADDDEDERRIRAAESRALKAKKSSNRFSSIAGQKAAPFGWRPQTSTGASGSNSRAGNPKACFHCGSLGHWKAVCPNKGMPTSFPSFKSRPAF